MRSPKEDEVQASLEQLRGEEEEYEELLRSGSAEEIAEYEEGCTNIYGTSEWHPIRLRQIATFESYLAGQRSGGCLVAFLAALGAWTVVLVVLSIHR